VSLLLIHLKRREAGANSRARAALGA